MSDEDERLLGTALRIALQSREEGGWPFGAVLVKGGVVVAEAQDRRLDLSDPTAHPELLLVRSFCQNMRIMSLRGYSLYSSVEPCPMCAGAIYWAGLSKLVYSVPQSELQKLTGGPPQLKCETVICRLGSWTEVRGPLLLESGLAILRPFNFFDTPEAAGDLSIIK